MIRALWQRPTGWLFGVVIATTLLIVFGGLSSFGIWDPIELDRAEMARAWLEGAEPTTRVSFEDRLTKMAFSLLGTRGWSGRMPFGIAGLATVLLAAGLARLFSRRASVYVAAITAFNVLFLLNSRLMVGHAVGMFAQTLLALSAAWLLFFSDPPMVSEDEERRSLSLRHGTFRCLVLAGFSLGLTVSIWSEGVLLGALPPLGALVAAALIVHQNRSPRFFWSGANLTSLGRLLVAAVTLVCFCGVAQAVVMDGDEWSTWLGGRPQGLEPPTFDVGLETVFHAFAPFSALLPVALGRLMLAPTSLSIPARAETAVPDRAAVLAPFLLLWIALGYGCLTLFGARYGVGAFLPVPALAIATGLLFLDAETDPQPWRGAAVVSGLFGLLLLRDYLIYPESPLRALSIQEFGLPEKEAFNPKLPWKVTLGLFAGTAFFGFWAPTGKDPALRAPYTFLKRKWEQSRTRKAAVGLIALLWLGLILVGAAFWFVEPGTPVGGGDYSIPTQVVKGARALGILAAAAPLLLAALQLFVSWYARLGRFRMVPNLAAGAVVAAYLSWGFVPALSDHLSPRSVFDRYHALANPEEPLGQYRVDGRVANYYVDGEVTELDSIGAVTSFLASDTRGWLVFPTGDLAAINKVYRKSAGEHLFVADATSAKLLLATNQPLAGRKNENFIAAAVRREAPTPAHPTDGRFESAIELIGYDLELPRDGFVGAGDDFVITWYWKALRASPGSFKVFLHIDGQGHRLNGDHDPVEGKYPVHLWEAGDIIVDRQELTLPGNYRPGQYTLYIGLFQGNRRLTVDRGAKDDADRFIAGKIEVR